VTNDFQNSTPGTTWTKRTLLRHRSLLLTTLAAAALILSIGWWSQNAVRRTLEDNLRNELRTAIEANVTALDLWIQAQLRTATLLATDPTIRDPANAVLEQTRLKPPAANNGPGGGGRFGSPDPTATALARALDERLPVAGYQAAVLVGTNGRVVASSGRMRLRPGTAVPADHAELFHRVLTNGKPALVTPFKPVRPRGRGGSGGRRGEGPGGGVSSMGPMGPIGPIGPMGPDAPGVGGTNGGRGELQVMQVLAPVHDAAGNVSGVLAVILRPEAEFTRVLSVARPGASGETFAFDPEGRLLSQSRFDDQLRQLGLLTNAPGASSALNLVLRDPGGDLTRGYRLPDPGSTHALMRFVAEAIAEPAGVSVVPARDYRGVPVVGAWHWMEDHQFGVVTKIDASEAFQPLRVLRLIFQILLLLVILAAVAGVVASHIGSTWRRRFNEAQLRARQLGQYTLIERIGEGAMGVVYRARHALLRRETAVKLLLPDRADEDLIRQFEHEVQLTCRLTHPNTIQVYDYGHTADGIFYYAMELLEGLTLQDLADVHGAVPEERAIHLLRQAAGSLQEAHAAGLIHRDIKPGNLFLCERGGMPDTLKVLDFGLVRDISQSTSSDANAGGASRFVGTPLYMAPETIRQPGHGDAASDLYALGAVAYLLVTGQPVFSAGSVELAWEMHTHSIPVPPSRRAPGPLSSEFEALILACLAKNPVERPHGMADFLDRLERCPKAHSWTAELRAAWWSEHIKPTVSQSPGPQNSRPPSEIEATLRIDLSSRDPGKG
jgi:serine/threonine protein kinase